MTSLPLKLAVAALGAAFCAAGSAQTAPAPESYTAETTYAKLAPKYPFITIASSAVPASVEALRDITYVRHGGRALQLDLYLPKATGGQGAAGAHGLRPRRRLAHGRARELRADGDPHGRTRLCAATVSYRLSPEAPYPAAIHDVKAALRWMRAHAGDYGIDPARLAVAGGSAGGQIASLVGVTNGVARFDPDSGRPVSSAAQAIVNIDGLSDFTSEAARKSRGRSGQAAFLGGRLVWRALCGKSGVLARGLADLLCECGHAADPVHRQRAGAFFRGARGDDCEDGCSRGAEQGGAAAGYAAQFLVVRSLARADRRGDGAVFG